MIEIYLLSLLSLFVITMEYKLSFRYFNNRLFHLLHRQTCPYHHQARQLPLL